MRKVNWGIVSTARINRRLIPAIHESERAELLAIASRNHTIAMAYADQWRIPEYYSSYEALIQDERIDVVYIPLPNDMHVEWTIRALQAGKHVLCEKPLCQDMDEFRRIRNASQSSGKTVMEAFMYLHHPQTRFFKEILESREIGEVRAFYSEFVAKYDRPPDNYRMDAARGGGALWDLGVYPVSFFRLMDPTEVTGVSGTARTRQGIDMSFWGMLEFASGNTAQFVVSFETEYSTRTSILCTKGRLDLTHPYNAVHACRAWITQDGKQRELEVPRAELYHGEVENMNDVVSESASPLFTLEDSWNVLEVILKLRQAASLDAIRNAHNRSEPAT